MTCQCGTWNFLVRLLSYRGLHTLTKLALVVCLSGPVSAQTRLDDTVLSDRWQGFWLGQSIGNWTGLVTEMDKVGGQGRQGEFYTQQDWTGLDEPAIWSDKPSEISDTIDFILRRPGEVWGADDDTDIEYMYLWTMHRLGKAKLTPHEIQEAWLRHIYDEKKPTPFGADESGYQNYLWVSNQAAHELMLKGVVPPQTSAPSNNPHGDMIDAQLTTEIFGLLAPGRPGVALDLAYLPVRTAGAGDAVLAAEFYIVLHALAAERPRGAVTTEDVFNMAQVARRHLPEGSTPARMFDFIRGRYDAGFSWEETRDALYVRYQIEQRDGYSVTQRGLYCNGCFASGINFAASLVSLFYGGGDLKETIKIATLCGWDSDNPAATWGGLLGFMLGRNEIERLFGESLSDNFHIHRTRKGFADDGMDTFGNMAKMAISVSRTVNNEYLTSPE
jgi:hypothetical protein